MTLKDVIWVQEAQKIIKEQENEYNLERDKAIHNSLSNIYLSILDVKEICKDTNYVQKAKILGKKAKPINNSDLPSLLYEEKKKQDEYNALSEQEKLELNIKKFKEKLGK